MAQEIIQAVTIKLSTHQVARLFEQEFDGWCPVCKMAEINLGESICCDCFKQALAYHVNTCGCSYSSMSDNSRCQT